MTDPHVDLATAERRFEAALGRLDGTLRTLTRRVQRLGKAEADARALQADRNRLSAELDKALVRARVLDDSAGEVARRLVGAMETVRGVLGGDGA